MDSGESVRLLAVLGRGFGDIRAALGQASCVIEGPWETLGHLGAIWGSSGVLWAVAGGPYGEILSISLEIQHVNVPMMWSQGGPSDTKKCFCLEVLQELKVSNEGFD